MILPSNCCKHKINTINHKACIGFIISIKNTAGIVPINAPNTGINAVTPIRTLISNE